MLCNCHVTVDQNNRELVQHGTTAFPVASYLDDLRQYGVSWHWHEELEAAVVTEGEAAVTIGTRTVTLRKGEGFFVNAGVLHSCHPAGAGDSCLHSVVFHPRLVGGSAESIFYQKYVRPVTENHSMEGICLYESEAWQSSALGALRRAWSACEQEPADYELLVRSALSELMAALVSGSYELQTEPDAKGLRDEERIKKMLAFIHQEYAGRLTIAEIAGSASVSESECLRCFRATIGTTPMRYLRSYRIEQAAQLLTAGSASIGDVALQSGFQDVSYFSKTFREIKGCTPKEYRTRQQYH